MGSRGRRGDGGGGLHPGAEGGGRARVSVTLLLGGFGGAACGEGAPRGRVQELGWLAWGAAVLRFPSGAPAAAEFGGGTLRLGMRRGRGGGRGGDGGLRLPSGELGYGRRAWDTTLGPLCRGDRASGLSLHIPSFVLKENS